jgi:hypothetical protein
MDEGVLYVRTHLPEPCHGKNRTVVRLFRRLREFRKPIGLGAARYAPSRTDAGKFRAVQNQAEAEVSDTLDWLFCECYTGYVSVVIF